MRGKGRLPLESSSSSIPRSFPSPLPSVPDGITNSSPPLMSYITSQEMKCILHRFASWSCPQHERFLQDLVAKAVPGKFSHFWKGWSSLVCLEQTDHLVSLSASYVFGMSGFKVGLGKSTMNLSGSWRSVSQTFWQFYQAVTATAGKD